MSNNLGSMPDRNIDGKETENGPAIENSVSQAPPEDTSTLNLKITEQIDCMWKIIL